MNILVEAVQRRHKCCSLVEDDGKDANNVLQRVLEPPIKTGKVLSGSTRSHLQNFRLRRLGGQDTIGEPMYFFTQRMEKQQTIKLGDKMKVLTRSTARRILGWNHSECF